jgi:hypothetical protein
MGLITTPRSPLLSIVWSSLNLSDRLPPPNDNIPSKTCYGGSYAGPETGDGDGRFGYDFGNATITPKVNWQEDPMLPVLSG